MRLWTFRDPNEWRAAEKAGRLRADGRRVMERGFRPAYRWMMSQMRKRIVGYGGRFPLWAWAEKGPADLRRAGHGTKGSEMLLVTCEVPAERVLLSDFAAWHFALNGWHLGLTEAEDASWERRWQHRKPDQLPPAARRRMERSWERMFDFKALAASKVM